MPAESFEVVPAHGGVEMRFPAVTAVPPVPLVPPGSDVGPGAAGDPGSVHIDCDACEVRGLQCGDCVVTVLLGAPPDGVELDPDEQRALQVLAESGLVPPLRLVHRSGGAR